MATVHSGSPSIRDRLQAALTRSLPLPVRQSSWHGIKGLLEPRDLAVYRSLLPAPLAMPDQPLVLVEFSEVTPTWHEGIVSIACRHRGETGWHGLYWAIDSYFPFWFGWLVGYPKFLADRMTFERGQRGAGATGEVSHRGRRAFSLRFTADDDTGADRDPGTAELLARIGIPAVELPYFLQVPPAVGPSINRLSYREIVSRTPRATCGHVTAQFDVDEPWARLFPDRSAVGPAKLLGTDGRTFGWLTSHRA